MIVRELRGLDVMRDKLKKTSAGGGGGCVEGDEESESDHRGIEWHGSRVSEDDDDDSRSIRRSNIKININNNNNNNDKDKLSNNEAKTCQSFRVFYYLLMCLEFVYARFDSVVVLPKLCDVKTKTNHDRLRIGAWLFLGAGLLLLGSASASELDKTERFLDRINEQSIAAVFIKAAYGSTTKRSIPDNAYIYTTLATPLLTTYRYSDGNQEWYRVDVKEPEKDDDEGEEDASPESEEIERERDYDQQPDTKRNYGVDLEKDHALPTSAPAADILKNNNNKNYNNPNRYNNDRLRPELTDTGGGNAAPHPTEPRTSTAHSVPRNVRPTKSMFGKEVPSYVPPSRSFFTPPLPPEYLNPFADKPTLRGTNSDTYQNRRPIPPPSLMPKKDRIPFRPDLPPVESGGGSDPGREKTPPERKKTLNTPSQNANFDKLGEFYGLNRFHNESNFEYEPMVLIPSISRILSGSNGRKEDIPDILLRTVTATPPNNHDKKQENVGSKNEPPPNKERDRDVVPEVKVKSEIPVTTDRPPPEKEPVVRPDTTTPSGELLNLANVKEKTRVPEVANSSRASSYEVWHVCWNVHVYLVVFLFVLLAAFSIVKLLRFDKETHMFSKSYFLAVHLLLTTVCVLRIFYLAYDPYNMSGSFSPFVYDLLHGFPLSLLATTFAVLVVFLLKRTLNHLKVKTRPVFLVVFGLGHMFLCFCLNLAESLELFGRNAFLSLVCRFVYVLLCWSLGLSYVYLYRIIKNVLAKKSQNLSETCSQNISYASHITIAVALLFTLLGFVQLYGLFFIKVHRFSASAPYHWILWGFELSVRFLEISIVTLLAVVVSLRMSQREKQNVAFPLFPCTTSDSSTDNIYPNNCSTNLNALNYSLRSQARFRQDLPLPADVVDRPNLLKASSFQAADRPAVSSEKPVEPERTEQQDRFERPSWGSQRFEQHDNFPVRNFERETEHSRSSGRRTFERDDVSHGSGSGRSRTYERAKYYVRPEPPAPDDDLNVYSEPLDLDRRSRSSWNNSGRRSVGRAQRKNTGRPDAGVQTLPNHQDVSSMLVDENGFVRFRHMGDVDMALPKRHRVLPPRDIDHYSDA